MRLSLAVALCACTWGSEQAPEFPADYAASYLEVRSCRPSSDHDLNHIRVLADPLARDAYAARDRPFPAGAVVLKEQYDPTDTTCRGPVLGWTVMRRLDDAGAGPTLHWRWQRVDAARTVVTEDEPRCYGCHAGCGAPPEGYQGTCAVP